MKRSLRNFKKELRSSISFSCYMTKHTFLKQIQKNTQGASPTFVFLLQSRAATKRQNFLTSFSCYLSKLLNNKTVVVLKCKGYLLLVLQAEGIGFFFCGVLTILFSKGKSLLCFLNKKEQILFGSC